MTTFITIIFVIVSLMMILSILLQAGKGGGLGSALGGGASQGVFGGGGGADFMSKLTQGFAATFMISAMYLAYASAHAGSEFLASSDEGAADQLDSEAEINFERLGPRARELPSLEEGQALQAKASALVPPLSEAPLELLEPAPAPSPVEPGDSPQGGAPQPDSVPGAELDREPEPANEPADEPADEPANEP